ncbi:MAG: CopD family protein, partial [Bauldia litoralis]
AGGWLTSGWLHAKLMLVVLLSAAHGFQAVWVREFRNDLRRRPQRFYRFVNEFPTLMMIGIVILVVVKPF